MSYTWQSKNGSFVKLALSSKSTLHLHLPRTQTDLFKAQMPTWVQFSTDTETNPVRIPKGKFSTASGLYVLGTWTPMLTFHLHQIQKFPIPKPFGIVRSVCRPEGVRRKFWTGFGCLARWSLHALACGCLPWMSLKSHPIKCTNLVLSAILN